MRSAFITTLILSSLGASASAQTYWGEPPNVLACIQKGLHAREFGRTKISQIHSVRTQRKDIYYCTATTDTSSLANAPWGGFIQLTKNTTTNAIYTVTTTDDFDHPSVFKKDRFQITTSKWIARPNAEGPAGAKGAPEYCAYDTSQNTPPAWGLFDPKLGKGGQFVEVGPIGGVPSGYVDIQLEYIGGVLHAFWVANNGDIDGGRFVVAANKQSASVQGVTTFMKDNGAMTTSLIHSHTGMVDLAGNSHAFILSNGRNQADGVFCPSGASSTLSKVLPDERYHDVYNSTWTTKKGNKCDPLDTWDNNPAAFGGTALYAQSDSRTTGKSDHVELAHTHFVAMAAGYANNKSGDAKLDLHYWVPYRDKGAAMAVSSVIAMGLGKGPIKVGVFGNIGFDITMPWIVTPSIQIPARDGYGKLTLTVPFGTPKFTLWGQVVALDLPNSMAYLGNNARLVIDNQ